MDWMLCSFVQSVSKPVPDPRTIQAAPLFMPLGWIRGYALGLPVSMERLSGAKAGVGGEKVWPRLANNCQMGCYMQVA